MPSLQGGWKVKEMHKNALRVFSPFFFKKKNLMLPPHLVLELLHISLLESTSHNKILVLSLTMIIEVL